MSSASQDNTKAPPPLHRKGSGSKGNASAAKSAKPVTLFDCLTTSTYEVRGQPLTMGSDETCDIHLGIYGFQEGVITIKRSGTGLELTVTGGTHLIEINGTSFDGGLLPDRAELSLAIDKSAFFFIRVGNDAVGWAETLKNSPKQSWELSIFEGGSESFEQWRDAERPAVFPGLHRITNRSILELIDEIAKRSWDDQVGLVYNETKTAQSGFFARQFKKLAAPPLKDEGENRDPRCFLRFRTDAILAIHPTETGDEELGESENKRFLPKRFSANGVPLTGEGREAHRFACPHCRGELPPGFLEKPPHMLSIIGDSMAGKSYYLTIAINQLKRTLQRDLRVRLIDADPKANDTITRMIAKLFHPGSSPEDSRMIKTQMAGETYGRYMRHGKEVSLPKPFGYRISRQGHDSASMVFYDNAGEHFRPDNDDLELSNATEHVAWASGLLFLFDPLQHRDVLPRIPKDLDPQVASMMGNRVLRFDQDVILAELTRRIRQWRQLGINQTHQAPLALVVGKHDLITGLLPLEGLTTSVCADGKLSLGAIEHNSNRTREFLEEYCPDIVAAAEDLSDEVMYFPASAFGCPAISLPGIEGVEGCVPDPRSLKPYLVEAPFLWLLSKMEPDLVPT